MSRFDAAINCLSVMADRDFANGAPHRGQFRAAIALLEAAGKVDKVVEMAVLSVLKDEAGGLVEKEIQESVGRIRALLDALPDTPEGGKG
jgi:hypothetical protein